MLPQLHAQPTASYNPVMGRELKTDKIVMRVRPTLKQSAEDVASATGVSVTEMFVKLFEAYRDTEQVAAALEKAKEAG